MGRAILYLKDQDLTQYRDLILDNCLNDNRYSGCEHSRAVYLYPLIRQSEEFTFYRSNILKSLQKEEDKKNLEQLFDFARLFARDGDIHARLVMHERLQKGFAEGDTTGARELILLDGPQGLLSVLKLMAMNPHEEMDKSCESIIRQAEDDLGLEDVVRTLKNASSADPDIAYVLSKIEHDYEPSWSPEEIRCCREDDHEQYIKMREAEGKLTWEEAKRDFSYRHTVLRTLMILR